MKIIYSVDFVFKDKTLILDELLLTASTPIFVNDEGHEAVVAVAGLLMKYTKFYDIFLNSSRPCLPNDVKCQKTCQSDVSTIQRIHIYVAYNVASQYVLYKIRQLTTQQVYGWTKKLILNMIPRYKQDWYYTGLKYNPGLIQSRTDTSRTDTIQVLIQYRTDTSRTDTVQDWYNPGLIQYITDTSRTDTIQNWYNPGLIQSRTDTSRTDAIQDWYNPGWTQAGLIQSRTDRPLVQNCCMSEDELILTSHQDDYQLETQF